MSLEDVQLMQAAEAWLQDQLDEESRKVKVERRKGGKETYTLRPVIEFLQQVVVSHAEMQRQFNELRVRVSKAEYENRKTQGQLVQAKRLIADHRQMTDAFFSQWNSFLGRHEQQLAEPIVEVGPGAQIGR